MATCGAGCLSLPCAICFVTNWNCCLRCAGFEVETIYGSYELDEFEGDSEKLIAVAPAALVVCQA